ncbi:MAG: hypothetical protein E6R03_10490 [Hyphomicrobiaceae bacterium]|nr:MAG: hypothetical protein E6R03_10490 [Hyphomicrobiaceae bacterium]
MDIGIHEIAARYGVRITHEWPAKKTVLGEAPHPQYVQLLDTPDGRVIFVANSEWLECGELALHELAHAILGFDMTGNDAYRQEMECYALERQWALELTNPEVCAQVLQEIDRLELELA